MVEREGGEHSYTLFKKIPQLTCWRRQLTESKLHWNTGDNDKSNESPYYNNTHYVTTKVFKGLLNEKGNKNLSTCIRTIIYTFLSTECKWDRVYQE